MPWYCYLIMALVCAVVGFIVYRERATIETAATSDASHLKNVAEKEVNKAEADLRKRL